MIHLSDLTAYERVRICNGCGPKSWKSTIPTWHGRDTCCAHDLAYWIGGDEEDRAEADRALYDGLIRASASAWFGARLWMRLMSLWFYVGVRVDGHHHFHYGTPRTLADLRGFRE